jgi:hypothetical protein
MRTRSVVLITTAMALIAVVALFRAGKSAPAAKPPPTDPPDRPPAAMRLSPAAEPAAAPEIEEEAAALTAMVQAIEPVDGKLASVERLERTLAIYKEVTVYPPWSRPAAEGSAPHLLQPNAPASMGQPFAADRDGRKIRTDVQLDRWFIGPGERATATLTISRDDEESAYEPDAALMRVEYYDPVEKAWPVAAELPLSRQGDKRVAVIDPAAIPVLATADPPPEVRLLARVEIGLFYKDLPILFRYANEQPFEVTGPAGDQIAGGSLEVDLEVDVHHVAPTLIQAVLYDAAGIRPIATYEKTFHPTRTGPQIATLQFFGKVLREAGVSGPYRIKSLHGHVLNPGAEPAELFWWHADDPPLMTRAYSSSQFSDAPWSSPDKEHMVARYRELIDKGGI